MKRPAILLLVFILAFSVRLYYVAHLPGVVEADAAEYDRLALCLAAGKGYVNSAGDATSLRPPLYPALLALIYTIFGHSFFVVRLIQAAAGALTVCLLYIMARRIFNDAVAMLTGVLSSFYMSFVMCSRLLYTETFFTFTLVLITFLTLVTERPSILRLSLLGILCGLLTLLRSNGFFVSFIVAAALLVKMKGEKPILKRMTPPFTALLICFIAVLTPWTIRNYMVHGKVVLVSTNAGLNIYQAVTRGPEKMYDLDESGPVALKAAAIPNDAERNSFYLSQAANFYREHPLEALKMSVVRFLLFLNVIDWEIIDAQTVNYHFLFILPFAVFGAVAAVRNRKDVTLIMLTIAYFAMSVLLFQGTPRYRMPIDGYMIMLGSYGICELIASGRARSYRLMGIGAYFFACYLFYRYSMYTKDIIRKLATALGLW